MGEVGAEIERRLRAALAPRHLRVVDQSHLHAGHAGARPEGQTHFMVEVVSEAFRGQTPVARHRRVNSLLADLLRGPIHALALHAAPPEGDSPT